MNGIKLGGFILVRSYPESGILIIPRNWIDRLKRRAFYIDSRTEGEKKYLAGAWIKSYDPEWSGGGTNSGLLTKSENALEIRICDKEKDSALWAIAGDETKVLSREHLAKIIHETGENIVIQSIRGFIYGEYCRPKKE